MAEFVSRSIKAETIEIIEELKVDMQRDSDVPLNMSDAGVIDIAVQHYRNFRQAQKENT